MYKVFFNHRKIILTNQYNLCTHSADNDFTKFTNELELKNTIINFKNNSTPNTLIIYNANINLLWECFKNNFYFIEASGGLVQHQNSKFLFIFRRNQWDLPKGKLEPNENIEVAALREVEEETSVKDLKIVSHLTDTWHCYEYKDRTALKLTRWYLMHTNYNKSLKPQIAEEITEVKWVDAEQVNNLLNNTLPSIVDVWESFKSNAF